MKKIGKILLIGLMTLFLMGTLTSCIKPFDEPELSTIEPSQTAFLIPLVGDTQEQGAFQSEELLNKVKVPTKEVQIPHRWLQTGRMNWTGKWIASARLIIVERKPETREWTESTGTGTSNKNEGITAESKESIGFMARMNASAQIDESDSVKFLYRYNSKTLADIMDSEIRARIESRFVEECAKRTLEDILINKETIMKSVREDVIPYFKERGITITVIGMKGEFTYLNAEIQKSIDNKFKSAQDYITAQNENKIKVDRAKADAEAIKIQAETITSQIKLKELENQQKWIDKWNGQLPEVQSGESGMILNFPVK